VSARDVFVTAERRHLGWAPAVDVFYVDAPPRAVVHVELPGVDPATIDLEVRGRELVVRGVRPAQDPGGRLFQQVEIPRGAFRRVVELGAAVAPDGAEARYDAGILEVTLPLARQEPRRRTVRVEEAGP
jgi:HSP20 family protein